MNPSLARATRAGEPAPTVVPQKPAPETVPAAPPSQPLPGPEPDPGQVPAPDTCPPTECPMSELRLPPVR